MRVKLVEGVDEDEAAQECRREGMTGLYSMRMKRRHDKRVYIRLNG